MLAFAAVGLEAPETGEAVFGYAWSGLLDGRVSALAAASNLGMLLGLPSLVSLIPLWVLLVLGVRWIWRSAREGDDEQPKATREASETAEAS